MSEMQLEKHVLVYFKYKKNLVLAQLKRLKGVCNAAGKSNYEGVGVSRERVICRHFTPPSLHSECSCCESAAADIYKGGL